MTDFSTLNEDHRYFLSLLDNPDFAKCVVEHPAMREALREVVQREAVTAMRYATPRGRG